MTIKSLDEYICLLGPTASSLRNIAALQDLALKSDWLQEDERQQVMTIKHHIVSAFAAIRTCADMLGEHTQIDIPKVQKRLQTRWNKDANNADNNDNNNNISSLAVQSKRISKTTRSRNKKSKK